MKCVKDTQGGMPVMVMGNIPSYILLLCLGGKSYLCVSALYLLCRPSSSRCCVGGAGCGAIKREKNLRGNARSRTKRKSTRIYWIWFSHRRGALPYVRLSLLIALQLLYAHGERSMIIARKHETAVL